MDFASAPSAFVPFRRRVARFLRDVSAVTSITDASLSAYIAALPAGEAVDHSTLSNYRAGRRGAPLELLWAILHHGDLSERCAVLQLIAGPLDLRVVSIADEPVPNPPESALRLMECAVSLSRLLQPGSQQSEQLALLAEMERLVAGLRAAILQERRPCS